MTQDKVINKMKERRPTQHQVHPLHLMQLHMLQSAAAAAGMPLSTTTKTHAATKTHARATAGGATQTHGGSGQHTVTVAHHVPTQTHGGSGQHTVTVAHHVPTQTHGGSGQHTVTVAHNVQTQTGAASLAQSVEQALRRHANKVKVTAFSPRCTSLSVSVVLVELGGGGGRRFFVVVCLSWWMGGWLRRWLSSGQHTVTARCQRFSYAVGARGLNYESGLR